MLVRIKRTSTISSLGLESKENCPHPKATWDGSKWVIALDTLEDLFALIDASADLVVGTDFDGERFIEIYDDHRE